MKNRMIFIVNVLIVFIVSVSVVGYARVQMKRAEASAVSAFKNTAHTMEEIVSNYLADYQRTCDSWSNYINASDMTMEEAVDFVKKSKTADEITAHVIWADSRTGLATDAKVSDASDFTVSYEGFEEDFFKEKEEDATVHITRRYTNPVSGRNVIAFYNEINLKDENGKNREALVLRVLPISYLNHQWRFLTGYENAQVALIEQHGTYVIQPSIMKNSDFYSFIYSYNQGVIDTEKLENFIVSNDEEDFYAKNARNELMFFCMRHIQTNDEWAVVVCVPNNDLTGEPTDWTIPFIILFALGLVLFIDISFFWKVRKKDMKIQATMASQLSTISRQEDMLRDALSAAVAANSAKSNFLSNMSHDIRTPMNAIVGLSTLLAKDADNPEKVREHTKKIAASSQHLLGLINDILDMSKIESGKTTLNVSEINLAELVDEIVTIVRPQAKAKNQELEVTVMDLHNEHILGDKLRMSQIFINLLSNAVKYTQENGNIQFQIIQMPQDKKNYAHYRMTVTACRKST